MSGPGAGPMVQAYRSQLCSTCAEIEFTFLEQYEDIGTLKDISERAAKCPMCAFMYQLLAVEPIRSIVPERTMPDTAFNRQRYKSGGLRVPQYTPLVRPQVISVYSEGRASRGRGFVIGCNYIPRAKVNTYRDMLCPGSSGSTEEISTTRTLDFEQPKQWLKDCETKHGGGRNSQPKRETLDIFLIDVIKGCLIRADTAHKYVALSYVVGGVRNFQSTKSTVQSLTEDGAFDRAGEKVPAVIRDAIQATTSLGMQYLWTDCVCIVQDDPDTKLEQISQMDVIYSHAYVTLVSVSGVNSNNGLSGVQSTSRPKVTLSHQYRANLGRVDRCIQFMASPPGLLEILSGSTYDSRGWTYQERVLSRRILYFTNWQVYYECRAGCAKCELELEDADSSSAKSCDVSQHATPLKEGDEEPSKADESEKNPEKDLPYENAKVFEIYASHVEQYSVRELTYSSDVLNAFQGVLNALVEDKRVTRQTYCGIPEDLLDLGLLWSPAERNPRRHVKLSGGAEPPSWSWAGWIGPVSYSYMIQDGYLRDFFKSEVEWVNPSPSASVQCSLRFWAYTAPWKAFDYTGGSRRLDIEVLQAGDTPALYITDSFGQHCGVFLDFRDKIQSSSTLNPDEIQIVLLSKTCLANVADIFDRTGFFLRLINRHEKVWLKTFKYKSFRQGELERCLSNVMWIRWKNQVAERIAIGVVHEDAWAAVQGSRKLITLV